MSLHADNLALLRGETYTQYGDAAQWGDMTETVSVIVSAADEAADFGRTRGIVPTNILKVRVAEVAEPAEDDTVVIPATTATYRIISDPKRGPQLDEWLCEAVKLA